MGKVSEIFCHLVAFGWLILRVTQLLQMSHFQETTNKLRAKCPALRLLGAVNMQNSDPTYIGRRGSRHVPTSSVRPAERRNDKLN